MAISKVKTEKCKDVYSKKTLRVPIMQELSGGRKVQVREEINIVEGNKKPDDIIIPAGICGPKLAELFTDLMRPLSLLERNEVLELALRQLVMMAVSEATEKNEIASDATNQADRLHMLLSGHILNKKPEQDCNIAAARR
jgi:hypothetical protein